MLHVLVLVVHVVHLVLEHGRTRVTRRHHASWVESGSCVDDVFVSVAAFLFIRGLTTVGSATVARLRQ